MAWARRSFGDAEVWVRVDTHGDLLLDKAGRAEMIYRPGSTKRYRPSPRNLGPPPPGAATAPDLLPGVVAAPAPIAPGERTVIIYTDGACTGNPGPMGLGVVILDGEARIERSEYLGEGTNNVAELTAIKRALEILPEPARDREVVVHSDSAYAIGLLTQGWRAKANQSLVAELRALCKSFPQLRFVKVAGHAGVAENERCDALAGEAIVTRTSRTSEGSHG